jgi:heptosyltransferase-3
MRLRRNVLIFHQAALGDFIVTWPLAVALGRLFPQSRVLYVTHASKGQLAEKVIGVESIDVEGGWHTLYVDEPAVELPERCEQILSAAHTIVSFVSSPNDAWERNVRLAVPDASLIRLTTKPPTESNEPIPDLPDELQHHVIASLVHQLKPYPAIQAGVRQIVRGIAERGVAYARTPETGLIVIHLGAGKPEKCWPVERFVELAERLKQGGRRVRVLLGEAELERWPADAIRRVEQVGDVRRPATFVDLLNELAAADALVGNDSGPAHLAAIIGVPTVTLFGTSPDRWRPLGPRVRVIRRAPLESISIDEVVANIAG